MKIVFCYFYARNAAVADLIFAVGAAVYGAEAAVHSLII